MKGRSQRLPAPAAPAMDDWGDGEDSWTVDCTCGVNYDDGEEMVNCDDCGVWVHTRCSRYVKEEESFTCDKCKAAGGGGCGSRAGGSNSNEEAEVAELLAELPTKGDKCLPPPPAPANHVQRPPPPARVWFETPMEERVHIQGLPGGDPAIFEGSTGGSVLTASLWKACGYIPKKFNFKYREYRCWDDDELDNPASTGADVLFSLSKETALPGPSMAASVLKSDLPLDPRGRDGKGLSPTGWLNPVKKERNKLRGFGTTTGKRKEEDPARIKEKAVKKARLSAKAAPGDKATGSGLGFSNCNPNISRDEPLEGSNSVSRDEPGVVKRKESLDEHVILKRKESAYDATTDVRCKINGVDDSFKKAVTSKPSPANLPTVSSREKLLELASSKPEKVHKQHSEGADVSSGRDGSANSDRPLEHDSKIKEKDDHAVINGLKQSKHSFNLNVSSSAVALEGASSKFVSDDFRPVGSESSDKPLPSPDLDRKLYSSSVEVKTENDTSWGSILWPSVIQPSPLTCSTSEAEVKTTSTSFFESPLKQSPVSCQVTFANATCKNLDNDQETEVTNQASSRKLSVPELQEEQPADRLEVQERETKLEPGVLHAQESSRSGLMDTSAGSPRGIKRACSSTEDILGSPIHMSDADLSTSCKTVTFQKRMKVNADDGSENERMMSLDPARDNLLGDTSDSVKSHLKSSRSSLDKSSQSSKSSLLPASKHKSGDIKEHKHHPSSKTSSTENSVSSTGSGKPKSSSLVQSNSMPIKFRNSMSHRKHDKNSSSSHISNKASGTSVAALPPNVSPLTLSDEELAKRLHQELNSSPRVSRASRGFHGAGMQFSSPTASSMLSKRSSSSNSVAKAQDSVSKREPRRDGLNDSSAATNLDYLQPSAAKRQETRHTNGSARRDSHGILGEAPSTKKSSQPSSFTGPTMRLSSSNL